MRSRSHTGVAGRDTDRSQAVLPQRDRRHRPHQLYIVGIGPGRLEHLTLRATEVLKSVDCVAGYGLYIDLIQALIDGKILEGNKFDDAARIAARKIDLRKALGDY